MAKTYLRAKQAAEKALHRRGYADTILIPTSLRENEGGPTRDGIDPNGNAPLDPVLSVAEKSRQVTAAMHNTQDKRVLVFNTVNDDIFAHGRAAASGT